MCCCSTERCALDAIGVTELYSTVYNAMWECCPATFAGFASSGALLMTGQAVLLMPLLLVLVMIEQLALPCFYTYLLHSRR